MDGRRVKPPPHPSSPSPPKKNPLVDHNLNSRIDKKSESLLALLALNLYIPSIPT